MRYLKKYELFKSKWEKQWVEVWHIPYKYHLQYLLKIMDEEEAQKWSKYIIEDHPNDLEFKGERTYFLKDKNGEWIRMYLNNFEIKKFKKLSTYMGLPEISQDEKDSVDSDIEANKYNI